MVATSLGGSYTSGTQFVCDIVCTDPLSCATIGDGGIAPTDLRDDSDKLETVFRGSRAGCSKMPSMLVTGPD